MRSPGDLEQEIREHLADGGAFVMGGGQGRVYEDAYNPGNYCIVLDRAPGVQESQSTTHLMDLLARMGTYAPLAAWEAVSVAQVIPAERAESLRARASEAEEE